MLNLEPLLTALLCCSFVFAEEKVSKESIAERSFDGCKEYASSLKRARSYAMQSIQKIKEGQAATNQTRRYPLWTGDPGVAIYLWDCLQGTTDFPTLDVF